MVISRDEYFNTFTQNQSKQKYHHPDDDLEQFAFARTLFQLPKSKLLQLEIWGGLERNTTSHSHKSNSIKNIIILMMILNSLPLLELYLNLPMQSCLTSIQNMGMTREKYNIKFTQIQFNQ